jgi:hypothetical protein
VALFLSSFNFFFSVSIHFASIIYTTYTAWDNFSFFSEDIKKWT